MKIIKQMAEQLNLDEKTVAKIYLEGFRKGNQNLDAEQVENIEKYLEKTIYS